MFGMAELYYFSPTGGTKRAGESFCRRLAEHVKEINLGIRKETLEQPCCDLVVAAVPVFGGRIPSVAAEKLNQLHGKGKKAVTLVVYGNRAYEDALLELNHIIEGRGFQVAASAALVAQHSMAPEVGKGRPDEEDRRSISDFADKVLEKLENGIESTVKVPGNEPYKKGMNMQVTPISCSSCNQCGKCENVCPTGAIQLENGTVVTNPETCILCMACAAACPEHARILPPSLQEKMEQMLGALKSVRQNNEYFL